MPRPPAIDSTEPILLSLVLPLIVPAKDSAEPANAAPAITAPSVVVAAAKAA